jgi:hypothetical protein
MATSQISLAIQAFRPDVYNQLITLENYCYNNCPDPISGATVTDYQTQFKALSDAIVAWMQSNWAGGLGDFIMQLYTYKLMVDLYSASPSQITASDANNIYNCNGWFATMLGYASNYYFDAKKVTDPQTHVVSLVFTNLPKDVTAVSGAYSVDSAKFTPIEANIKGIIVPVMNELLFQDLPQGTSLSKAGMANYIFNTLHYKSIYQNLNVGGLTLPPGV